MQAEDIDVQPTSSNMEVPGFSPEPQERAYAADVANDSRRPIRNIACRIEASHGACLETARLAGLYTTVPGLTFSTGASRPPSQMLDPTETSILPLMRAGESGSFIFAVGTKQYPDARMTVRFTDDAWLHWQIDPDLHLEKLNNRDDW
jgi:hypothetical protein